MVSAPPQEQEQEQERQKQEQNLQDYDEDYAELDYINNPGRLDFQNHDEQQQQQQYEQQRQFDILIMNISELLNQIAEVRGVQNKLNILKEVFNRLLTHKIILEKYKMFRETIISKIQEFRENEVARLDIQFMNISQSICNICIEYNNNFM